MNLNLGGKIAGVSTAAIVGGVVFGIGAYFTEEAIANEIQKRNWVIPLGASLIGFGLGGYLAANRVF